MDQPPRTPWLVRMRFNEPQAFAIQAGLLLALAAAAAFVVVNAEANVARLNLRVGFDFLWRTAGFDIAQTLIPYPETASYMRAFWVAFLNTILLGALAILGGTILGLAVALMRLARNPLLSLVALAYIEAVRNIPLLLQLFFWYFGVMGALPLPRQSLQLLDIVFLNKRGLSFPWPVPGPGLPGFLVITAAALAAAVLLLQRTRRYRVATGRSSRELQALALGCLVLPSVAAAIMAPVTWDLPHPAGFNIAGGAVVTPEFVAMVVGMTIYGSAFIAELIRGGVATVGKGQTEAGMALGLRRGQIYAKIIIPQVFRSVLPPLMGQYISIFKNSSLAAAIGYPDLMLIFAGTALNQTGQPLEIMGMTMLSYLLVNLAISSAGNVANRRVMRIER